MQPLLAAIQVIHASHLQVHLMQTYDTAHNLLWLPGVFICRC